MPSAPEVAPPPQVPGASPAARAFRWHLLAFVLGNAALTGVNVVTGAPWWAVWPLLVWGLAVTIHFLVYRAVTIDDAWVEERTVDLRLRSYDLGHIDTIHQKPAPSIENEAGGAPPPSGR